MGHLIRSMTAMPPLQEIQLMGDVPVARISYLDLKQRLGRTVSLGFPRFRDMPLQAPLREDGHDEKSGVIGVVARKVKSGRDGEPPAFAGGPEENLLNLLAGGGRAVEHKGKVGDGRLGPRCL